MEIKVRIVKENADGSANAMVDFDKEGLEFLVQEGVLAVISEHIRRDKNAQKGKKLREKLEKAQENANDVWERATGKKKVKKEKGNG